MIKVRDDLILRQLQMEDSEEAFNTINHNRQHLRQWLTWVDGTNAVADTQRTITKNIEEMKKENKTDMILGIFHRDKHVGNVGIHNICYHSNQGEIGYWLSQDHEGMGIMTDCIKALTSYGFNELGLNRISIQGAEGNIKSCKVPERLGFKKEGVMEEAMLLYGKYVDLILYAVVKKNWEY